MNKTYILFSSFKRDIFTLVFPDGMAEHRVPLFRNFVVNGLIQMTTYCESYQLTNVGFYDKDESFDDCGLSVIQACRGVIGAVYAFKPSCRCQRYYYDSASLEKMSCLYENCRCAQSGCTPRSLFSLSDYTRDPSYCGYSVEGNEGCRPPYLAMEPEEDCAFKASDKFFAIGPGNKLWLYPRFPCGWLIGVHWKGIRRSWLDTDYVLDDEDLKDAVAAYVESEVARRVDKDQATADKVYADYRMKAGDIIFREERDLKPRATRLCIEGLDLSELVQIYPDNPYPAYEGYQCAQKKTEPVTDTETFLSAQQSVSCDSDDATLTSTVELPAHLSIVDNELVLAAGYSESAVDQAAADATALAYVTNYLSAGLSSDTLLCTNPPPCFFDEDCEETGTPAGWTDTVGGGTNSVDWDYTGVVLAGAQSLLLRRGGGGFPQIQFDFGPTDEYWMRFRMRFDVYSRLVIDFQDSSFGSACNLEVIGTGQLQMSNGANTATTADALAAGTMYNIWIHVRKEPSGVMEVGFSTTNTEPLAGTKFASFAQGTGLAVQRIILKTLNNSDTVLDDLKCCPFAIGDFE